MPVIHAKIGCMLKRSQNRQNRGEGTFSAERKGVRETRRGTVFLILGAAAVLGWVYVLFGSGTFDVDRVDTNGLVNLERGEVTREVNAFFDEHGFGPWRKNLLLIDADALSEVLETRLFAEHVTVDKSWPDILRLNIQERQSSVIVIANNDFYVIDRNGIAAERIEDEDAVLRRISQPSTDHADLPILTIRQNAVIAPSEPFVDRDTVEGWLQAFHDLTEAGFGYRNAVLEHPTSTKLILNLFESYDAYFDLLAPIPPQISAFYTFMKGKPADLVITSYVDVRVPGRVYSK